MNNNSNCSLQDERKCRICFEAQKPKKHAFHLGKSSQKPSSSKTISFFKRHFYQTHTIYSQSNASCCSSNESTFSSQNELISPCLCTGSIKYVHVECLEKWRDACFGTEGYFSCHQCKSAYEMRHPALVRWLDLETFCLAVGLGLFLVHFLAVHTFLYATKLAPFWWISLPNAGSGGFCERIQLLHSAVLVVLLQFLFYSIRVVLAICLLFSWFRWLKIIPVADAHFEQQVDAFIVLSIVIWGIWQNLQLFFSLAKQLAIPLYKSVPISRKMNEKIERKDKR